MTVLGKTAELDVVGVFPSALEGSIYGGVQAAAREAWRGIVSHVGQERASALCYEAGASKTQAVFRAFGLRGRADVVLVWHIHLLKLLPFLDYSGSRVVLVLHGIEAWLKHDTLTRFLLNKVDLILTDSDHTWSRFEDKNPDLAHLPHRTLYLGAGSSLSVGSLGPADPPSVLMIARLDSREDYKGHRQLIEAWPQVLRQISNATLRIVGGGDLRPQLVDLARRHGIQDAVHFHGQVSDAEKERLLSECRCLAMPSRGEGFGLVYLEAMRMGRPCLVSDADAGREVVNPPEAGLAVNPDDLRAVAEAVGRMLTPGLEWDQWSALARSRYGSRFTSAHYQHRLSSALFANQ